MSKSPLDKVRKIIKDEKLDECEKWSEKIYIYTSYVKGSPRKRFETKADMDKIDVKILLDKLRDNDRMEIGR